MGPEAVPPSNDDQSYLYQSKTAIGISVTLLKNGKVNKVLYWNPWFHLEPLTTVEPQKVLYSGNRFFRLLK